MSNSCWLTKVRLRNRSQLIRWGGGCLRQCLPLLQKPLIALLLLLGTLESKRRCTNKHSSLMIEPAALALAVYVANESMQAAYLASHPATDLKVEAGPVKHGSHWAACLPVRWQCPPLCQLMPYCTGCHLAQVSGYACTLIWWCDCAPHKGHQMVWPLGYTMYWAHLLLYGGGTLTSNVIFMPHLLNFQILVLTFFKLRIMCGFAT